MGRYTGDSGLFTYAEYKNRGVIKLAPDALVFISSNVGTTVIAPVTGITQKVDFRDGISSISVQNNVDPPGSSTASIEIIAPIQDDSSNYWITFKGDNGRLYKSPYFAPMMEVKIFFKGRFLVNNETKYYPAFWGFITNVDDNYSGGVYKISLTCADMLHWWSHVQVLFTTGVLESSYTGQKPINVLGSTFGKANSFQIIYSLVQQMGYETFTAPTWIGNVTPQDKRMPSELLQSLWKNMMAYWKKRFSTSANFLRMYGARGNLILDPTKQPKPETSKSKPDQKTIDKALLATSVSIPFEDFDVEDTFTAGFQTFYMFDKMEISQGEYLSKLDIATNVKNRIEYEFFQDVNGNFIFKPPFYNLNTKNILPYRIKPVDIINYSFGINSDEIVTALEVSTGLSEHINAENSNVTNTGYHMDLDLTNRFGERFQKITLQYLTASNLTQSVAVGHLSKINLNAYFGSVTIPGRPEMKLGFPVYIEHKDRFYYVASINHSFDFGGSFTTTLSLKGERPRIYDINPKTNQWDIQKSKIYKWQYVKGSINPNVTSQQSDSTNLSDPAVIQENLFRGANYIRSSKVGQYTIVDQAAGKEGVSQSTVQQDTIPYTDEEGYKVIGSFRYGRGILLKPGTLFDNAVTASNLTIGTPEAYLASNQAEVVTNMKPAADYEGLAMDDYFKTSHSLNPSVETVIPEYMSTLPVPDIIVSDEQIVNMTPKQATGYGQPETNLSKDVQDKIIDAQTNGTQNLNLVSMGIGGKNVIVSNTIADKIAAADAAFEKDHPGQHIQINESFRTFQRQAELYAEKFPKGERVAPPGYSFHEKGLAIDVTNWQEAEKYLNAQGLKNNLKDDKVHFSYGEFDKLASNATPTPAQNRKNQKNG